MVLATDTQIYQEAQNKPKCNGTLEDHTFRGNPYDMYVKGKKTESLDCYWDSNPDKNKSGDTWDGDGHEDRTWDGAIYGNDEYSFVKYWNNGVDLRKQFDEIDCPKSAWHVFEHKHSKNTADAATCCNTDSGSYCTRQSSLSKNYTCYADAESKSAFEKYEKLNDNPCYDSVDHPKKNKNTCPWDYKPGTSFCAPWNNEFCTDSAQHDSSVCKKFASFWTIPRYRDAALAVINTVCTANPKDPICTVEALSAANPLLTIDASIKKIEEEAINFDYVGTDLGKKLIINNEVFQSGKLDGLIRKQCESDTWKRTPLCSCFYNWQTEIGKANFIKEGADVFALESTQFQNPICTLPMCQTKGLKLKSFDTSVCPDCVNLNIIKNISDSAVISGNSQANNCSLNDRPPDGSGGSGSGGSGSGGTVVPAEEDKTLFWILIGVGAAVFITVIILAVYFAVGKKKASVAG